MTKPPEFTPEQIIEALRKTGGGVYLAAEVLRCSAKTIYNYLAKYPECQEAKEHEEGKNTDLALVGLRYHLHQKKQWAIKYQLSHKGGYSRKQEIKITGGGVVFLLPDNGRGDSTLTPSLPGEEEDEEE
jgi:hypothetical protein